MKKGKFRRKARLFHPRFVAMLVSTVLVCSAAFGATLAYLVDETDAPLTNIFNPSQVTSKVEEDFDGTEKSNVRIQNTGDIPAYIRADIVVTWMDKNGNVLSEVPEKDTDYTISYGTGWIEKDGFYYWPNVVQADDNDPTTTEDMTGVLINSATALNTESDTNGTTYYVSIEILCSAIQSVPETVVEEAWKVSVVDGVITG